MSNWSKVSGLKRNGSNESGSARICADVTRRRNTTTELDTVGDVVKVVKPCTTLSGIISMYRLTLWGLEEGQKRLFVQCLVVFVGLGDAVDEISERLVEVLVLQIVADLDQSGSNPAR